MEVSISGLLDIRFAAFLHPSLDISVATHRGSASLKEFGLVLG
jgi:hypothetical protein